MRSHAPRDVLRVVRRPNLRPRKPRSPALVRHQLPLDATNGIFESQLKWTVTAKTEDGDIAYVTECHQAGIFTLKGYDEETLNEMVKKACPQVLFPYLRETIGQMIAKGGFPAFYLPPVSIALMYENKNAVIGRADSGTAG